MSRQVLKIGLWVALLFPVVVVANTQGIKVSGVAKVSVVPDIAMFTFAIDVQGQNLIALKRDVDVKTAGVVGLAEDLDIEAKYILSAQMAINPQYDYKTKRLLGYKISRVIKLTLTDLSLYSDLVNGAVESGITTISRIQLASSQKERLALMALESAAKAAKNKALVLARSSGVGLGSLISMEEAGLPSRGSVYRYKETRASSVQSGRAFEPGEITIEAKVIAEYAILRR